LALTASSDELGRLTAQLAELREASGVDIARLNAELTATREANGLVVNELEVVSKAHSDVILEATTLSRELTELKTRYEAERSSAQEKLVLLQQAREALGDQFKSLANDILEEKSRRFAEQNQTSLGQLLAPLKTQLTEFKGKVEEVYVQEGKDRTALSEQVRQLVSLNQALSQDAQNLTRALKGDVKMQGNWGELVLERVLESAGLVRGREYEVQESQKREDGTRGQADVVIRLPEERHLVVDSKVSLLAYESYVSAETDEERTASVRRHLESVRNHIKGLSGKQYQSMYGIKQLDFVLLFVPIEPAFMLAITNDAQLFMHAWEKNVLLVSPSTLLFVVRTVAHLWRQEAQTRNAQDIARRGADLYDKLSDFVKDLTGVGERLKQAQDAYDAAHKRLATGKGNVIRQAEMLRTLGVKPTKKLPVAMIEQASDDELRALGEIVTLARANTPTDAGNAHGALVLGGS
jgi:DNA recombination protein RmuC